MRSKLSVIAAMLSVPAFAQFDVYDNPVALSAAICDVNQIRSPQAQLAARHTQFSAKLRDAQRLLTSLRADEQAKNAAFNLALNNYRRALNGDETPSPAELQITAATQPLLAALDNYYSLANNRVMWQDAIATLRQLGARFDAEGRTIDELQRSINNIVSDQSKWATQYGSFEAVYSQLLQYEDQLATARAQRGAIDVKALRIARQNAEFAFETAKSKRRDTEYVIEGLEAQLLRIATIQRAAQNCPQTTQHPPIPQMPLRDASTVNIVARGRCGNFENFETNAYSNQTFRLNLPPTGAGPISGNFTGNTAASSAGPIAPGPQNTINGSTTGNASGGNWNLASTSGTWLGSFFRNSTGEWETNGTFCNRVNEQVGCVFRWSNPQIAPPVVTLSDLKRCVN